MKRCIARSCQMGPGRCLAGLAWLLLATAATAVEEPPGDWVHFIRMPHGIRELRAQLDAEFGKDAEPLRALFSDVLSRRRSLSPAESRLSGLAINYIDRRYGLASDNQIMGMLLNGAAIGGGKIVKVRSIDVILAWISRDPAAPIAGVRYDQDFILQPSASRDAPIVELNVNVESDGERK